MSVSRRVVASLEAVVLGLILTTVGQPRAAGDGLGIEPLPSPESKWEQFEFLLEALRTWHREAAFVCHFEERKGRPTDRAALEAGQFDGLPRRAWGIVAKSPGLEDASMRYERLHDRANVPAGTTTVGGRTVAVFRNANVAHLVGREVGIRYDPHSNHVSIEAIDRPQDASRREGFRFWSQQHCLNPVALRGGLLKALERAYAAARAGELPDRRVTFDVVQPDAKHLDLLLHKQHLPVGDPVDQVSVSRYRFFVKAAVPYLVQIDSARYDNGVLDGRSVKMLRDFAACPAVMLPRTILGFGSELIDGKWVETCTVWHSDDLGERQPTEDDFVLNIPARATYLGFKVPVYSEGPQVLRLADFRAADAMHYEEVGDWIQRPALAEEEPSGVVGGIALTMALAIMGLLAWIVYRRTKTPYRPTGG